MARDESEDGTFKGSAGQIAMDITRFYSCSVIRDKIHFGTDGGFGPKRAILHVEIPDLLAGDILMVSGQIMLDNRTLVGGQMIPALFTARFVAVEPYPAEPPNLWATEDMLPGGFKISKTIGHNMSNGVEGVYGDLFVQGSFQASQDYGRVFVTIRAYVSSTQALTTNWMPVLDRTYPDRNQSDLTVLRMRAK